jgi:hypothetical protein
LFLGMIAFIEIGRTLGARDLAVVGTQARVGVGVVDGAVFALLALLLGFSFNSAAARFDKRRDLIAQEVNTIHAAWDRMVLLPDDQASTVRADFRRYLDLLVEWYTRPTDADPLREGAELTRAHDTVWSRAVEACVRPEGEKARMLLLPMLTDMFRAIEMERLARRMHPPKLIFFLIGIMALAGAMFSGYSMATGPRNWLYIVGVSATIAVVVYVIIELEYPRLGVIRVDAMDQALTELRDSLR